MLPFAERPAGKFAAGLQGEDGESRAGVGDEVSAVMHGGTGEPFAAFALMRFQPGDATLETWIISGNAKFAGDDDYEARSVAVAGGGFERLPIAADFPVGEKAGSGPATIGKLQCEQFC